MNALEIENLDFSYPDGRQALKGVSFSVREGECLGVIGPNGAGKSSLLLHLNGILPEHIGEQSPVRIFGRPINRANIYTVRREVGLLFQDPDDQLFCPTVLEDVAFGPQQQGLSDQEVTARALGALERVGLTGFEQRAPHHLSHGEKRRVCLAGLLACNARILALDEPSSDLDPRGKRELKALLRSIPATKLIASHDLEMIFELCQRVIVLDQGRIAAEGTTEKILDDEGLMLAHGLERPHVLQHRHPH